MTYDNSTLNFKTLGLWTKTATANMGLAKAGVQWLIEQLCFLFSFVLGDSLVLLNARLRQALNRYGQV